jgi:hypothetical protein
MREHTENNKLPIGKPSLMSMFTGTGPYIDSVSFPIRETIETLIAGQNELRLCRFNIGRHSAKVPLFLHQKGLENC